MAYSIISKPSSISLSGNMPDIVLSATAQVAFKLKRGNEVLLDEVYTPDADAKIIIPLKSIVEMWLSVQLPVTDFCVQELVVQDFIAELDGTATTYRVVKGGIDAPSVDATAFLKQNWLTWQPQSKAVKYNDPEWLTYYATEQISVKAKGYKVDGTSQIIDLAYTLPAGKAYTLNVQYAHLLSLFTNSPSYVDVWVESASAVRLTYVQRYILTNNYDEYDDLFVFANSLGGLDTIRFNGTLSKTNESIASSALFGEDTLEYDIDINNSYSKNSGYFATERHQLWAEEFINSIRRYHISNGSIKQVFVKKSEVKSTAGDLNAFTFTFAYTRQTKLLNLPRAEALPDVLEFVDPAGNLFFLAPRLVEYPRAILDSSYLFLVQSPYESKFRVASASDFMQYLRGEGIAAGNSDAPSYSHTGNMSIHITDEERRNLFGHLNDNSVHLDRVGFSDLQTLSGMGVNDPSKFYNATKKYTAINADIVVEGSVNKFVKGNELVELTNNTIKHIGNGLLHKDSEEQELLSTIINSHTYHSAAFPNWFLGIDYNFREITTDFVKETDTNQYWSAARVASLTSDDIHEGSFNRYIQPNFIPFTCGAYIIAETDAITIRTPILKIGSQQLPLVNHTEFSKDGIKLNYAFQIDNTQSYYVGNINIGAKIASDKTTRLVVDHDFEVKGKIFATNLAAADNVVTLTNDQSIAGVKNFTSVPTVNGNTIYNAANLNNFYTNFKSDRQIVNNDISFLGSDSINSALVFMQKSDGTTYSTVANITYYNALNSNPLLRGVLNIKAPKFTLGDANSPTFRQEGTAIIIDGDVTINGTLNKEVVGGATDNSFVSLTKAQSISGVKSFTDHLNLLNTKPTLANGDYVGITFNSSLQAEVARIIPSKIEAYANGANLSFYVTDITGAQQKYIQLTNLPDLTAQYNFRPVIQLLKDTVVAGNLDVVGAIKNNGNTLIHTGNIGSQSVNYASSAGAASASDVYAWAKAASKPSYSASEVGLGNVNNTADSDKSVNYAGSAGTANNIVITDNRGADRQPTYYSGQKLSTFFNEQIPVFGGNWGSGITVRGWTNGYNSWQLIGGATTGTFGEWYLREGIDTWGTSKKIIHSDNIGSQSVNYAGSASRANQLQAFTEDNFTGGNHYIKAIRSTSGWSMRLKTCYDGGAATTNDVSVSYADGAGNADTVDGLHIHTGRNNEANKVVRTQENGYIHCGYINSESGNEGNNSIPARIWGTNGGDSYLRTYLTSALIPTVTYSPSQPATAKNGDIWITP